MCGSVGGGNSPFADWTQRPEVVPYLWGKATGTANMPFTPYSGQLSPGVPGSIYDAQNAASGVANYDFSPISAASAGGYTPGLAGITNYLNPFIDEVINRGQMDIDRQRQMATNQNASTATLAGAFGGDRLGVENALTNEAYGRLAADQAANLRAGGFNTAANLLMQEKGRDLTQNQFNAELLQQANLANQMAGVEGLKTNLAGSQILGQLGQLQFGQQQAGTNAAYQEFLRQLALPYQQNDLLTNTLGTIGGALGGQWVAPGHPFTNAFLGNLGQAGGQALIGGGSSGGGLGEWLWG